MSSTRFIELDAAMWSTKTVGVMARNISGSTFDLAAATLSVRGFSLWLAHPFRMPSMRR